MVINNCSAFPFFPSHLFISSNHIFTPYKCLIKTENAKQMIDKQISLNSIRISGSSISHYYGYGGRGLY